ncbi:S-protein homolog 5-like [Abrus precatorius]|uniref:S-protein homolog n=1 Tax=Abrus precatorius TaxID=3816 RepID=A0A8B8KJV1_ABRPR|nr:S-protein homolog 5-like [Abrus precatorius]
MNLVYCYPTNMLKCLATFGVLVMIIAAYTLTVPVHGQNVFAQKNTVRVQNDLGSGIVLYLHCKSKDDDLGLHVLPYRNYQEWSFRDNFGGTTLFWCSMQWNYEQHSFEIYSTARDNLSCSSKCWRSIRPDGAYFYMEVHDLWMKRYSW